MDVDVSREAEAIKGRYENRQQLQKREQELIDQVGGMVWALSLKYLERDIKELESQLATLMRPGDRDIVEKKKKKLEDTHSELIELRKKIGEINDEFFHKEREILKKWGRNGHIKFWVVLGLTEEEAQQKFVRTYYELKYNGALGDYKKLEDVKLE